MEVKEGYKLTEVGVIPEDWEIVPISQIATIQGGFAFNSKNFKDDGKFQIVKMSNLYGGTLQLDRSKSFLNKLNFIESQFLLNTDDVLITLTGTVGKKDYGYTYQIKKEKNLLLNQRVARIVFDRKQSTKYFFYQIKTQKFLNQFFEISRGGTGNQANVSTKDVLKIILLTPTVKEQAAIAKVLSDTDALIQSLEKLITKKQSIKQGTMQLLLTGKKRLPGFSGDWEVKKLGEIADIKTGKKNNENKIEDGIYPFFVRSQNVERIDSFSFDGEAILVPSEGGIGTIIHYIKGRFDYHQRVYKISNYSFDTCGKYIYYCMMMNFNNHATKNSVKATVDSLRLPTFENFEFLVPSFNEQFSISKVITDIENELVTLENKLDKYKLIKQGLMQNLLTGKIRLV